MVWLAETIGSSPRAPRQELFLAVSSRASLSGLRLLGRSFACCGTISEPPRLASLSVPVLTANARRFSLAFNIQIGSRGPFSNVASIPLPLANLCYPALLKCHRRAIRWVLTVLRQPRRLFSPAETIVGSRNFAWHCAAACPQNLAP